MRKAPTRSEVRANLAFLAHAAGGAAPAAPPRARAKPKQTEREHQRALNQWMYHTHPALYPKFFHIPQERQNQREAQRLKSEGVKRGLPDCLLLHPASTATGLALELKAPGTSPSSLSDPQREALGYFRDCGFVAAVAKGWETAAHIIDNYVLGTYAARRVIAPDGWTINRTHRLDDDVR